ncbi:MAG: helix-turn-helix domain-containing protein [Ornithinibacter sp.]
MSPSSFHRDLRAALRERALDVAARVTAGKGWSAVRMSAIADEVGVSRQTRYAEFGSRASLAEALVEREVGRVLDAVRVAMRGAGDHVCAVEAAVAAALREAGASALVHGALRSVDPAMDLLRLLTTDARPLVAGARRGSGSVCPPDRRLRPALPRGGGPQRLTAPVYHRGQQTLLTTGPKISVRVLAGPRERGTAMGRSPLQSEVSKALLEANVVNFSAAAEVLGKYAGQAAEVGDTIGIVINWRLYDICIPVDHLSREVIRGGVRNIPGEVAQGGFGG